MRRERRRRTSESEGQQLPRLKPFVSGDLVKKGVYLKRNCTDLFQELISSTHGKIDPIPIFSIQDLQKATNNFSPHMILGVGLSFVYRGIIENRPVAVKTYEDGLFDMFVKEVVSLSLIKHKNVVKLLGYCIETENPIIVYELLPNGTLHQNIGMAFPSVHLFWDDKLRIVTEVADALAYMHVAHRVPITHGSISSLCVLLDEFRSAKLSTFGFSKVQNKPKNSDVESDLINKNAKGRDIHLFGMMLVELLTENLSLEECQSITKEEILRILRKDTCKKDTGQMEACVDLAVRCVSLGVDEKPTMREIVRELRCIASQSLEEDNGAAEDLQSEQ